MACRPVSVEILLIALAGMGAISQAAIPLGPRIIGGEPVNEPVPYQVSLQKLPRERHFCGGVIIDQRHILTAAHCLDNIEIQNILVVAGSVDKIHGDRHAVSDAFIHPEYSINWNHVLNIVNDIAVLKVEPPFDFTKKSIQAIAISPDRVGSNVMVMITGWGRIHPSDPIHPSTLQLIIQRTVHNARCRDEISIPETALCSYHRSGTCVGDSGGPVVTQRNGQIVLVGIVSYGDFPCSSKRPDIFTRVSSFVDFIAEMQQQ